MPGVIVLVAYVLKRLYDGNDDVEKYLPGGLGLGKGEGEGQGSMPPWKKIKHHPDICIPWMDDICFPLQETFMSLMITLVVGVAIHRYFSVSGHHISPPFICQC